MKLKSGIEFRIYFSRIYVGVCGYAYFLESNYKLLESNFLGIQLTIKNMIFMHFVYVCKNSRDTWMVK